MTEQELQNQVTQLKAELYDLDKAVQSAHSNTQVIATLSAKIIGHDSNDLQALVDALITIVDALPKEGETLPKEEG